MNLLVILMLVMFVMGIILGAGVVVLWRWIKRRGALQCIKVNPQTGLFAETWERPGGSILPMGTKRDPKAMPLGLGRIWSHWATGRKLAIADFDVGLLTDVQSDEPREEGTVRAIKWDKEAARAVYPNGRHVAAVINSTSERKFTEEAAMDPAKVMLFLVFMGIIGLAVLGFILVKVMAIAGGLSHAH